MILLHGESCNFSTTLPNLADGKVYAFGPDMSPSLFMYDTTVVLLVATSTTLFEQRPWNSFKVGKTALRSR